MDGTRPDLRCHGEYLSMDWRCFTKATDISMEMAAQMVARAAVEKAPYRAPTLADFERAFINKGFRVVMEKAGVVVAVYNRDHSFSLWHAKREDFEKEWSERHVSIRGALNVFDELPWPVS